MIIWIYLYDWLRLIFSIVRKLYARILKQSVFLDKLRNKSRCPLACFDRNDFYLNLNVSWVALSFASTHNIFIAHKIYYVGILLRISQNWIESNVRKCIRLEKQQKSKMYGIERKMATVCPNQRGALCYCKTRHDCIQISSFFKFLSVALRISI